MALTFRHVLNEIMRSLPSPRSGQTKQYAREALRDAQLLATSINQKGWEFNKRQGYGRNGGGYQDGTATFTQNSRAVTGSGTAWTSAMIGWRIGVAGGSREELYEVVAVGSTTGITLDRIYEGTTSKDAQYMIYDAYAVAPADVHRLISVQYEYGARAMLYIDMMTMRFESPLPNALGDGNENVITLGPPTTSARYSTGTVTLAAGDATVTMATGTFPDWVRNRHIRFANESVLYKIASRTTDSEVELDREYQGDFVGAGKTYEIDPPGCLRIEIEHGHEHQFAYKIDYYCVPQQLVNDADSLEGDDIYGRAVLNIAKAYTLAQAVPWDTMSPEQSGMWKARADSLMERGTAMLRGEMFGNVPPEDQAVWTNYCR